MAAALFGQLEWQQKSPNACQSYRTLQSTAPMTSSTGGKGAGTKGGKSKGKYSVGKRVTGKANAQWLPAKGQWREMYPGPSMTEWGQWHPMHWPYATSPKLHVAADASEWLNSPGEMLSRITQVKPEGKAKQCPAKSATSLSTSNSFEALVALTSQIP